MNTMNARSSKGPRYEPQRRNRGTSSRTPVKVSVMPSRTAVRTLSDSGTFACARRTAAPVGSVTFQSPAARKTMEMRIAAVQLNATCQPRCSGKGTKISLDTATPSAMYPVYIDRDACGRPSTELPDFDNPGRSDQFVGGVPEFQPHAAAEIARLQQRSTPVRPTERHAGGTRAVMRVSANLSASLAQVQDGIAVVL